MYPRIILPAILTCVLCWAITPAWAEWFANIEGPDVFGNVTVIAQTGNERDGFVVQCDQQDQLILAYVIRIKEFESINPAPAELLIQADTNPPKSLSAELGGWNNNFAGVSVRGRTSELVDIVRMIGSAKSKINIGVIINGNRMSESFDSGGSTSAMKTVITGCKLGDINSTKANGLATKP